MKLIDLNYHASNEYTVPQQVISDHWPSLGYIGVLKNRLAVEVIKHINYEGEIVKDGIVYRFFRSRNRFWYIPFRTHRYIRTQKPQMIIIQGFVFPLQLIFLRLSVGNNCAICLQHHGEQPFKGLKGMIQQFADRFVTAYSFASKEMGKDWISAGVISSGGKCFEVMGVSTNFKREEKMLARRKTGMKDNTSFLWVGRLNKNKDPLTVLMAFEKYLKLNAEAVLYMIYQDNDLEMEVMDFIKKNSIPENVVKLIGKIPHSDLVSWFSAADFYVSGSHREGSGYALIEAMACGCIPVVTNIPSFVKITDGGNCGLLYEAGNPDSLLDALIKSKQLDLPSEVSKVLNQFKLNLSYEAYAGQVQSMMEGLLPNK